MSLQIPIGENVKERFNIRDRRLYCSESIFLNAYNTACIEILRRITEQLKLQREDVIIRRLISQDLELKEPFYKFNFEKGLNKNVIKTTPKRIFIAINGFTIPKNCSISQIIIWRDGKKARHWHIEGYEGTYFLDDPFLVDMDKSLRIDMYSESKKIQKIIFHGAITEETGRTINP